MRTLLELIAVGLLGLGTFGHGQAPNLERVLIAPNEERFVTVSKDGVLVASVMVPQGTLLTVSHQPASVILPTGDGRFEFLGDVEIHAQAASQLPPGVGLEQATGYSPLLLTGKDVEVVIVRTR